MMEKKKMDDKKKNAGPLKMNGSPWIPVSAQMHDHVMTLTGVPARKFFWDARTTVEAFAEVADYYQMDQFVAFTDSYNIEIEALGAKMIYSDHAMPTIDSRDPLIKKPADLLKLKTPDFFRDGRLLYALDCIKLMKQKPKGLGIGYFCGPFSMAVGMRSYPALIRDMRKQPQFARDLFTFIIDEITVPYIRVQKEYCDIGFAGGADAWACVPNLSVPMLMEWIVPFSRQLTEKASQFGVMVVGGAGVYSEEKPEKFDAKILHSSFDVQIALLGRPMLTLGGGRWHEFPLEPVLEYSAKYRKQGLRVPIAASVNARLLRDGPVDKIVDIIKRYIRTFAKEHELSINLSNIPADTPSDHVHAAVAAIHTFGRKPIAENLDAIKFETPRRETFTEWKRKSTATGSSAK
jgi:uroporphyrinogen-III decarboxylase